MDKNQLFKNRMPLDLWKILKTSTQSTCPIYVRACCCGLDVIITFLIYDIKNLIVMQKAQSNKPT